jgi:hypothetical protein
MTRYKLFSKLLFDKKIISLNSAFLLRNRQVFQNSFAVLQTHFGSGAARIRNEFFQIWILILLKVPGLDPQHWVCGSHGSYTAYPLLGITWMVDPCCRERRGLIFHQLPISKKCTMYIHTVHHI